ncbi:MAG: methylated-DNA--[protein]-cysteine S-methyltransferase [Rhodoferax sp.]
MKYAPFTIHGSTDSPLGRIIVAAHGDQLAGLWFDGQRHQPDIGGWPLQADHPLLERAFAQLGEYFAGRRRQFDLPLDLGCGSAFQQSVWRALLTIAPGATSTYGALSAAIGKPRALRAVGGAIGRNPFSIVVPCHRVIGADGSLTGYAGGLERKTRLLQLEGAL